MRRVVVLFFIASAFYLGQEELRDYVRENVSKSTDFAKETASSERKKANTVREAASIPLMSVDNSRSIDVANRFIEEHREEWKIQPYHELRPIEFKTPLNTKVKYSIYQDGVPVLNMGISIVVEKDLAISHIENNYQPIEKIHISKKEIKVSDLKKVIPDRYGVTEESNAPVPPVLVILPGSNIPQLAFGLSVIDKNHENKSTEILLRLSDGQILGKMRPRLEF